MLAVGGAKARIALSLLGCVPVGCASNSTTEAPYVWQYPDYSYDEAHKQEMFLPNTWIPDKYIPYIVAVLNPAYCDVANQLVNNIDPVFRRMTAMKNITLVIDCNYTAPQSISEAQVFFRVLYDVNLQVQYINALVGDYNPLVSSIASLLGIPFLLVDFESKSVANRAQKLASMALKSGTPVGPFTDFNNQTFLIDSNWYRTFLFDSVLGPEPYLGTQVFGNDFSKFSQLGIICDDSVLLAQFLTVDRGPFIVSVVTKQLDTQYSVSADSLNNLTSEMMDSWTPIFANCTAVIISLNTTYTMSLLPLILQGLLNTGFFRSQTVTMIGSSYVSPSTYIKYSDLQSTFYVTSNVFSLNTYNQPYPPRNLTIAPPSWMKIRAPIVSDPVARAMSQSFYYLTVLLMQSVYQPSYINYVISQLNWPPIITQNGYLRSSLTYGITKQQYNRCQFVLNVLGVTPSKCLASEFQQPLFNLNGYWRGLANLQRTASYIPTSNISSTSTTSTTLQNTTAKLSARTNIIGLNFTVGFIMEQPFVISCYECSSGYQGYAIEILGNLSKVLDFHYVLAKKYSTYQALMRALATGEINMAIGGILWTNDPVRLYGSNISIVKPILSTGLNILIRNDTSTQWFQWVSAFSNFSWVAIVILMVLLTLAFMLLDWIDPNKLGKRFFSFFSSYWFVFGSFVQASVEIMPVTVNAKLLSMVMWFNVVVFVSSFTASYTSNLLTNELSPFADSLSEALDTFVPMPNGWNTYPYYFINGSLAATYLNSTYRSLYNRAMSDPANHLVSSSFDAAAKLFRLGSSATAAFIGDSRINQWTSNLVDCWLITRGEVDVISPAFYSIIALPANSIFKSTIDTTLINFERLRLLSSMNQYYFDSQCSDVIEPRALLISDLAGLYMVLALGCGAALVLVCVEVLLTKVKLSGQRVRAYQSERYHFGKIYYAKVCRSTHQGLLLKVFRDKKDVRREAQGKTLGYSPQFYTMLLEDLNVGNVKVKKPGEMGLTEGVGILCKYLGNSPQTGSDRFIFWKKDV